jgi:hypothetical protein
MTITRRDVPARSPAAADADDVRGDAKTAKPASLYAGLRFTRSWVGYWITTLGEYSSAEYLRRSPIKASNPSLDAAKTCRLAKYSWFRF